LASGGCGDFRDVRTMYTLFWIVILGGVVAYTLTGLLG
jgi:hypothetical protein